MKSLQFTTRSSCVPLSQWDWELVFSRSNALSAATAGYAHAARSSDELNIELKAVDVNEPRNVEYLLSVVDGDRVLRSWTGKKGFTKSRYANRVFEDRRKASLALQNDCKPRSRQFAPQCRPIARAQRRDQPAASSSADRVKDEPLCRPPARLLAGATAKCTQKILANCARATRILLIFMFKSNNKKKKQFKR